MENVSYMERSVARGIRKRQLGKSVKQLSAKGLKIYTLGRTRSLDMLLEGNQKFVEEAGRKLRNEFAEARAEANEFITSPHLLFRPLSLAFFGLAPLAVPIAFVPWQLLASYVCFVLLWYLFCIAFVATEISMRPPWYRFPGLALRGNPPYWRDAVHDPLVDLGLEFEEVEFCRIHGSSTCAAKHGALRGWYIAANRPPPSNAASSVPDDAEAFGSVHCEGKDILSTFDQGDVAICVHGAGRDRRAFLRHSEMLCASGLDVLLFDLSEHGLSDGNNRGFSFGVREAVDVASAVKFVRSELDANNVFLIGTSTGATSSILAAADHCCPGDIQAIVAENPFSRPADLFCHHVDGFVRNYLSQNQHHVWRRLVFWLFGRVLLLRVGLRYNYGAVDAVPRINCPLFVMHSPADEVVPFSHGEEVFAAALEPREFWLAPNADHCALFDKYPDEWSTRVLNFIVDAKPSLKQAAAEARSRL
mmetsp:Transcript_5045/g.13580  ORF Transcript_5045/g.13580 Transcript_5045/m.13580 type:complete len:475 (-) Transcript_5045:103-1527(-)